MRRPNLGSLRRRSTSLFITITFLVLAVSGVLAFFLPFSMSLVGLHSLMGFLFIAIVGLHVLNNIRPLKGYAHGRAIWVTVGVTLALTALFYFQPRPVQQVLGLSKNYGPALDHFEVGEDRMTYRYSPAEHYRMELTVKAGAGFDPEAPPDFAIWLENQDAYLIKTLRAPGSDGEPGVPYWSFKQKGWEMAKKEADRGEVDLVSSPTPNASFDPADYILADDPETTLPYQLLIEINQPGDDQPSLVYSVEIDELEPLTFQTLELVGYPKPDKTDGKPSWSLYFADEAITSALELIDSALLTIERSERQ